MTVARAVPAELPALVSLYDEAAQWLQERGVVQWQVGAHTAQSLVAVETFVATEKESVVGGFCFVPPDPDIWPDAQQADACYLSGLVVARSHAGIGLVLLAHAEQLAASPRLRLDCWAGNEVLKAFYSRAGFSACGIVPEQTWRVQRFEKVRAIC